MLARIFPDRFILILLVTVLVASIFPVEDAVLRGVTMLSHIAIFSLFFFHGLRMAHKDVAQGLKHWRLQLAVFGVGYGLIPLMAVMMSLVLPGILPPLVWTGILFLAVLPSTVQSAIAYASMAGGNVAASVIAAAGSNLLAVVATPVLFALIAGGGAAGVGGVGGDAIGRVVALLLVPFILGQASQYWLSAWATRHRAWIGRLDKTTIIIAVYVAFSAAAAQGLWARLDGGTLTIMSAVVIALQAFAFAAAARVGRIVGFNRADRITLLFSGAHKSLATGAPIAGILFTGAQAGFIILPLILYHQLQLMVSAWIAARLGVSQKENNRST